MPTVEPLEANEAAALRPQLVALLQDCVADGASIGFLRPLDDATAERFWHDVIADVAQAARLLLVVREGAEVVGSIQLGLCQKPNGRHRAEVQKLLVHPRARRRGLGRQLMVAAETAARSARRTLLYLDTEPEQPAERLYLQLGWRHAGSIPEYACTPDGALHATAIYFKLLRG